jgi:hypothetical protein
MPLLVWRGNVDSLQFCLGLCSVFAAAEEERIGLHRQVWNQLHPNYYAKWRNNHVNYHSRYCRNWRLRNENYTKNENREWLKSHPGYFKNYRKRNKRRVRRYWGWAQPYECLINSNQFLPHTLKQNIITFSAKFCTIVQHFPNVQLESVYK